MSLAVNGISPVSLWESYVQHFSFTQLSFLFDAFNNMAREDMLTTREDVRAIISEWVEHQWSGVLILTEPNENLLEDAIAARRASFPMDFLSFIDVLKQYEAFHLTNETNAGFPRESIQVFFEIFDAHSCSSTMNGLKGKALFAVLDDLDIHFHTKEERQWYVDTVKRLDKNGDGVIHFDELCQIMRVVMDNEERKSRMREFNLVKSSKLPFDEVEDWNMLYQQSDTEGQGELQLCQVKELITSIGVTWDSHFSESLKRWLIEVDENSNGTIDFGEFCCLIGKMWSNDLGGIRGASRKHLSKDTIMSLQSVHGKFISTTATGDMDCRSITAGMKESLTMIRLSNGYVRLRGPHGLYVECCGTDARCTVEEEREAAQFEVTTLEDERIKLRVSNREGGFMFVGVEGNVCISDGNPLDEPTFPWVVMKQDDLTKKSWSRLLIPKRKPSKMVEEKRRASKGRLGVGMPAPGVVLDKQADIDDLDRALEDNAVQSRMGTKASAY